MERLQSAPPPTGPLIASLVDVAGVVIYLKIALFILGAPQTLAASGRGRAPGDVTGVLT